MSTGSTEPSTPILFFDRGCPYAHRVRALLTHLGRPLELREAPVGGVPAGVERYSPSDHLPLLVHGELVVTESRVMLDYLAELYEFADAYPRDVVARTRHRLAMTLVDKDLRPQAPPDEQRLGELLDAIEVAVANTPPRPTLLAMHLAPIWHAFRSWHPAGAVVRAVQQHDTIYPWLEAATRLDCVARNATVTSQQDLEQARACRLLPKAI